jgi:hypothetical protein
LWGLLERSGIKFDYFGCLKLEDNVYRVAFDWEVEELMAEVPKAATMRAKNLDNLLEDLGDNSFFPEFRDCDNYCKVFHGKASDKMITTGNVSGTIPGIVGKHKFILVLMMLDRSGEVVVRAVEPQNGTFYPNKGVKVYSGDMSC